jgi:hypothetical protein
MNALAVSASCAVSSCTDTGTGANTLPVWAWIVFAVLAVAILATLTVLVRRGR